MTRLVLLSDTHNRHREIEDRHGIPPGDVLVHAGDFTGMGKPHEIEDFVGWFATRPHAHKVCIAGNHDFGMQDHPTPYERAFREGGVVYLNDLGATVAGLRFWGTPWTPWFYDWAFNARRGNELAAIYRRIPTDTQVLVVHGPPYGILDEVEEAMGRSDAHVGSHEILEVIAGMQELRLYVCGHIHEARGRLERDGVTFVNASSLDRRYEPVHAPVVVEL
jgi:Icc-related predicted phosphoesterase